MHQVRNRFLFIADTVFLAVLPFLLYALRFERLTFATADIEIATLFAILSVPTRLATYVGFGIYRRLWRYASIAELELIVVATIVSSALVLIEGLWLLPLLGAPARAPLSLWFNTSVLSGAGLAGSRLYIRIGGWKRMRRPVRGNERRVLIAGAGAAGQMIVKELLNNPDLGMFAIGFADDDKTMHGMHVGKLPILGGLADIPSIIRRQQIDEIVIAMPTAPGTVVRQVVRAALDAGVMTRTVPGVFEILSGRVKVSALRDVEIEDLLRREPIKTDLEQVSALASNRTVLVTGAGGSIGSELCRQLAQLGPRKLVILGHGENPIFDMLNEIHSNFPQLTIVPVIADIRDRGRVRQIFEQHRPFAVFHAAAHKHVPLMEENVVEAITNNICGTRNLVDAALDQGTMHFVLISTDKAVRPTNVMGATKRVAEHIVQGAAIRNKKNFVAVRFGNVLGSRGSVVPTFVKQIKAGGPVTITHPDMRRYFMTIPEAVQLVLQAGALGKGGELFMLDMGEPVKIIDLARDLIRLSGLDEGIDIEIRVTGIRPGEKLYEEMFFSDELAAPTTHPKVLRARKESVEPYDDGLINDIVLAAQSCAGEETLREMLKAIVPDFSGALAPPAEPTPGFGVQMVDARDGVLPLRRRSSES